MKKEFRYVMYMYQLPSKNVISICIVVMHFVIMQYVLIKIKFKRNMQYGYETVSKQVSWILAEVDTLCIIFEVVVQSVRCRHILA